MLLRLTFYSRLQRGSLYRRGFSGRCVRCRNQSRLSDLHHERGGARWPQRDELPFRRGHVALELPEGGEPNGLPRRLRLHSWRSCVSLRVRESPALAESDRTESSVICRAFVTWQNHSSATPAAELQFGFEHEIALPELCAL